MARKSSLISGLNTATRILNSIERSTRQAQSRTNAIEKVRIREESKIISFRDKQEKALYIESRIQSACSMTHHLDVIINEYENILVSSLEINHAFDFDKLLSKEEFHEFILPNNLQYDILEPKIENFISKVKEPRGIFRIIPGNERKYKNEIERANKEFNFKYKKYINDTKKIKELRKQYINKKEIYQDQQKKHNEKIINLKDKFIKGDREAIIYYFSKVLEKSNYETNFPRDFRVAYLSDSKEIVIEYELPTVNAIPKVKEYSYIKSRDEITEKLRKPAEIKTLYKDIVASICLSTIYKIIDSDINNNVLIVTFNGLVQSVNPATGQDIHPCLITIRTTKERFKEINLEKVEKLVCLRNLGAQVSPNPDELIPIKPVVEFDMVDKRFVSQSDVLSDLDSRPNLMDLDPFEFENLVSNLFGKIGFEVKQTQSTVDGGVDAIAFDTRPILGGKIIIQAKRYKNTVDVSAVRDLYGTMINEGANKGILVCTSHYGSKAYNFANGKPIELIDGGGLLYLLEQQGIKAQIIFPDDE